MVDAVSESDFVATEGLEGWRPLYWGAKTLFETSDFATGARFVAAIADVVEELGHTPLVDLRDDSVAVQVITIGAGLTTLDLDLALRITAAAAGLGLHPNPAAVQQLDLAFDAEDPAAVLAFWKAGLGYAQVAPNILVEPNLSGSAFSFNEKPRDAHNRIHLDLAVPYDLAQARVDAVLAAGGRMLGDKYAPAWWSLIDPEGNVLDIATWQGRDELPPPP